MKRGREDNEIVELFVCETKTHKPLASLKVNQIVSGDSVYLIANVDLKLSQAQRYSFYVCHENTCIFSRALVPSKEDDSRTFMDITYQVYETHTLAVSEQNIVKLYVQLDKNMQEKWEVSVDMTVQWLRTRFGQNRFHHLQFFPLDIDPSAYGLKVDPRTIPQRTPLWFKMRGEVTGTKAYKFMGYWSDDSPIDDRARANMRFGTYAEEYAIMLMLLSRPHISISLLGWCTAEQPYPIGWGASPDGLITDETMTWDVVPESIAKDFDVKRGVLEIKSSRNKLSMEAYFIPQIYMEMISTKTCWCDLVRYMRSQNAHCARVYRIYRHTPTEQMLTDLLKYAQRNQSNLKRVIEEEQFKNIRAYFQRVASELSYQELEVTPPIKKLFDAYDEHKKKLLTVSDAYAPEKVQKTKWMQDARDLHVQIEQAKTQQEQARLIAEQIQLYTNALL